METMVVQVNDQLIAVVQSEEPLINDAASALDLVVTIRYEDGSDRIVIHKQAIAEDFFNLSTGVAGEVLQKFINYRMKIAIVGDFSMYTSKALRDFIYECNRGNHIFFVPDVQTAIDRLAAAL